jgi:hypothetical protein
VQRDGIRLQGLRCIDPTLAAFVGETVTSRYDPGDLESTKPVKAVVQPVCAALGAATIPMSGSTNESITPRR